MKRDQVEEVKRLDSYVMGHPKPLMSLSLVELWERFSFYGIRPLLVLFMTTVLLEGGLGFDVTTASAIAGIFGGTVYLSPLLGGWLADNWLGQKRATFYGAVLIALGHLCIALSALGGTPFFFYGLIFIVAGTGLFKTCASVMVGMLYKDGDIRRDSGFTIFYMGINIGGLIAPLLTGFFQQQYGWHLGFGIGGIGMLLALIIYYFKTIPDFEEFSEKVGIDRTWDTPQKVSKYAPLVAIVSVCIVIISVVLVQSGVITVNPSAIAKSMVTIIIGCSALYFGYLFFLSKIDAGGKKNLVVLLVLLIAAAVFWSTFEQQYIGFNLFTNEYTNRYFFGWEIPTVWFQSVNPLMIIVFAPIVGAIWIALSRKNIVLSSFTKFALGLVFAGFAYIIMVIASKLVLTSGGGQVSFWWIVFGYFFLAIGELCLSPVGLSIMTQIAPNLIKGQVMGLWFVAGALGNVVAGLLGGEVKDDTIDALPNLFLQLTYVLFGAAIILFAIVWLSKRQKSQE